MKVHELIADLAKQNPMAEVRVVLRYQDGGPVWVSEFGHLDLAKGEPLAECTLPADWDDSPVVLVGEMEDH